MKKITLLAGIAVLLSSCGDKENMKVNEEGEYVPKTELEKVVESAKNIEENGAYSAVSFNDGLLAEITLLDVKYQELADMDAKDTTVHAIEAAANASIKEAESVIEKIKNIKGVGIGSDHLKQAGHDLAVAFKEYAEGYLSVADVFAIPDAKWTDDQYNRWDAFDLKYHENYLTVGDAFNDEQKTFFSMNNLVQGKIVDASEIYNETKAQE